MKGVFICYRRDETAWCAGRLRDRLTAAFGSEAVFQDFHSIESGDKFRRRIAEAMSASSAVLVLIGPHWLDVDPGSGKRRLDDPEDFVRKEISAALEQEKVVVPVLIDGTPLPRRDVLPAAIAPLVDREYHDLRHKDFDDDVRRLIADLRRSVQATTSTRARRPALAALFAVALLLAYVGGRMWQQGLTEALVQVSRKEGGDEVYQAILGVLQGTVTTEDGRDPGPASVTAAVEHRGTKSTKTLPDGYYKLDIGTLKPQDGDHIVVSVQADNYHPQQYSFDYGKITLQKNLQREFKLKTRSSGGQ